MLDDLLAFYANPERAAGVDAIPSLRDVTEDDLIVLQRAIARTALSIVKVRQVGGGEPIGRMKELWQRDRGRAHMTEQDVPPLLELGEATLPPAIRAWLDVEHTDLPTRALWFSTRSRIGTFAVLYVDGTLPSGGQVHFHLLFDLWRGGADVVKQIDAHSALGLTHAALREASVVPGRPGYEPWRGVFLSIAHPFTEALAAEQPLSDLIASKGIDAAWSAILDPRDPEAHILAQTIPVALPPKGVRVTLPSLLGEVKGAGRLYLAFQENVLRVEGADWMPQRGTIGLRAFDRASDSRTAPFVKPGWRIVGITCAEEGLEGFQWCWELCLHYRERAGDEAGQAIARALIGCAGDGWQMEGDMPEPWLLFFYLLGQYGTSRDHLTMALGLLLRLQYALDLLIIGWMDLRKLYRLYLERKQQGGESQTMLDELLVAARSDPTVDRHGRALMAYLTLLLQEQPGEGMAQYSMTERGALGFLALLGAIEGAMWEGARMADVLLLALGHGSMEDRTAFLQALTAIAALVRVPDHVLPVHPSMASDGGGGAQLVALLTTHAQQAVLHARALPLPPKRERAWLMGPDQPVWSPYRAAGDLSEGAKVQITAACASYAQEAAAATRPVVGCYVVRVTTHRFSSLRALGVNELRLVAQPDGCWCAFGPPDGTAVVFPFVPGGEPLALWQLLFGERDAWELHLYLNAWWRDMRVAGEAQVLSNREGYQATPMTPEPRPNGHGKKGKNVLHAPRRLRLGDPICITRGTYGGDDQQAISRRLLRVHGVRAHRWRREGVSYRLRGLQARAWEQLDVATRIEILFGALSEGSGVPDLGYPEEGQIRGMRVTDQGDGTLTVSLGYTRGGKGEEAGDEVAAREVVCKGLEGAEVLLKLLQDKEGA